MQLHNLALSLVPTRPRLGVGMSLSTTDGTLAGVVLHSEYDLFKCMQPFVSGSSQHQGTGKCHTEIPIPSKIPLQ